MKKIVTLLDAKPIPCKMCEPGSYDTSNGVPLCLSTFERVRINH